MSLTIPFSAACERNKDPILEVLRPHFENIADVLEVGSGTAQHALHFAEHCPNLRWQTSDQSQYLEGICAQLQNSDASNVLAPICLDVEQRDWGNLDKRYEAIYSANTLHIMNQEQVTAFFAGLPNVVQAGSLLMLYGPFKYGGEFTSASNASFDQTLRARGVGSAIRDFEWADQLASAEGFELLADHAMPANNQCLVWRYCA